MLLMVAQASPPELLRDLVGVGGVGGTLVLLLAGAWIAVQLWERVARLRTGGNGNGNGQTRELLAREQGKEQGVILSSLASLTRAIDQLTASQQQQVNLQADMVASVKQLEHHTHAANEILHQVVQAVTKRERRPRQPKEART